MSMVNDTVTSHRDSLQPKALYILTLAELWERFSFYGIRALLILYLTSELKYSDNASYEIYGLYLALIYSSTVVGSYLADSYLGNHKAIYMGGFIIILGHLCLLSSFETLFFYGLAFIVTGTGLFKANISSFLGEFYAKNDFRKDAGFTIFYMGINIGSLIAPLICGYIGQNYGWNYGFSVAGVGILIGLLTLYFGKDILKDRNINFTNNNFYDKTYFFGISKIWLIWVGCILSVPLFVWSLNHLELMRNFLGIFGAVIIFFLLLITYKCEGKERKSMISLLIMLPFITAFFACFEQAGGSMSLFTDRHVDRVIGGFEIPTTWFQALNPFFIIIIAPFFSMLWKLLGKKNQEPIAPLKFSFALFQVGLGFWLLNIGISEANSTGTISLIWLILAILLHTTGELCLMPVAFSMVTKLAPKHFESFMMGVLFLFIAFAHLFAQHMAKYFTIAQETKDLAKMTKNPSTLMVFSNIFEFLIYFPIIAGVVLLVISPFLTKNFKKY